jgi:hypothetical protein
MKNLGSFGVGRHQGLHLLFNKFHGMSREGVASLNLNEREY